MTSPEAVQLDVLTGPGTLAEIHSALDRLWREHSGVPSEIRMDLAVAAAEIGANIVEHAGAGRPIRLQMRVSVTARDARIVFTDDGAPVTVPLDNRTMPDELAERGRGLALAQAVLGALSYERAAGTNRWTLVSRRFG